MDREKCLIDVDDVICGKGFIHLVNEFLHTNYDQEDAKSYYINDLIPKEHFDEWKEFFCQKNVYDYVELMPKVKEVIQELHTKYRVYFVTAFVFRDSPMDSGKILNDKFNFLAKEFPFIDPSHFIFIQDKSLIQADIRIDDSVKNLQGQARLKLLYTAYHNKNIALEKLKTKKIIRVNDWNEIGQCLLTNEKTKK